MSINMSEEKVNKFVVTEKNVGKRIDVILGNLKELPSRAMAQKIIKEKLVLVNGNQVSVSYKAHLKDIITFSLIPPKECNVLPEFGELKILFEDEFLIVVDKAPGIVVHPAPGHETGTLVHFILHNCKDLSGIGGVLRPGIVHRLDKDTSGILVIAKNDDTHIGLTEQFQKHTIHRVYHTLIWGTPLKSHGIIDAPLGRNPHDRKKRAIVCGGKPAVTHWKVIRRFKHFSKLSCILETGRTHQIRVHLASNKMPVVGDNQYGNVRLNHKKGLHPEILEYLKEFNRQALHASELGFTHPIKQKFLEFSAPPPQDFQKLLYLIEKYDQIT